MPNIAVVITILSHEVIILCLACPLFFLLSVATLAFYNVLSCTYHNTGKFSIIECIINLAKNKHGDVVSPLEIHNNLKGE